MYSPCYFEVFGEVVMNLLVKRIWILWVLVELLPCFCGISFGYINNAITSWGDNAFIYGAGTDPAMDTPEGIQRIMQRWKNRGYTGVYWRTDIAQLDPNTVVYHPMQMAQMGWTIPLTLKRSVDDVCARFDVLSTARQEAEAVGLQFCAYHPHIYSDGAPSSWSYHLKYIDDHPEVITIDREGTKQYMVPEYAYSVARQEKVNECVYLRSNSG